MRYKTKTTEPGPCKFNSRMTITNKHTDERETTMHCSYCWRVQP